MRIEKQMANMFCLENSRFFWEPDEYDDVGAKSREIVGKNHDEANVRKDYAASVRCVEDYEEILWK